MALGDLTTRQIAALPPATISGLTTADIVTLTAVLRGALTAPQVSVLSTTDQLGALSSTQAAARSPIGVHRADRQGKWRRCRWRTSPL